MQRHHANKAYRWFIFGCVLVGGAQSLGQSRPNDPALKQPATAAPPADPAEVTPAEPRWLERMHKDDRAALETSLGYAPPPFTKDLKWIGTQPMTWEQLRGKVVVLQSWTTASTAGRSWPQRLAKAAAKHSGSDLVVLALHTPEGAAGAEDFMSKKPAETPVILDPSGAFCDELGVFKQPANVIVDRQGVVRYVGLNANGLDQALAALLAEPFDPKKRAASRSDAGVPGAEAGKDNGKNEFPRHSGSVGPAKDIRGQRAPEMHVERWVTPQPNAADKVVVIDFWATWCGPCVASIPHMNDLAERFRDSVVVVGVSDEKNLDFELGLDKRNLKVHGFKYALALDPSKTMYNAVQIRAIPHCLVMSRDWIVRWQGHPTGLTADVLEKIVKADQASGTTQPQRPDARKRWAATLKQRG